MPVRIEDASPATVSGSSGVVYMAINVANFDRPSDMFAALYMGDWRIATWYKFPQGMDHSRIGNFSVMARKATRTHVLRMRGAAHMRMQTSALMSNGWPMSTILLNNR